MLSTFLDTQACNSGRPCGSAAVGHQGLACLLPGVGPRCWHAAPSRAERNPGTPAASRHHVVQSASLVERTLDMEDLTESPVETERRRRSLEQSYDAEATPDLFEAHRQQDGEASVSQRLERSWQAQADSPEPAACGQTATQPSGKRPQRRKVTTSATAVAAPPAPAAPAEPGQTMVADDADRSDRQLLRSSSANGGTSLAVQRAARRHNGQGRVPKRQLARPEQRQVSPRAGPAETFLQSLQDRLYKSRNAKRAAPTDAVSWYLNSVGNSTVLTRNEEAQLGAIIHLGASVTQAQAELQGKGSSDGEISLDEVARHLGLRSAATVRQRLRNSQLAKQLLMQYNMRLVVSVARQYSDRGVDFPDLLPAGVSGLERAIDRFDAAKGFKFSTYAHWWIRQAVSRCVQDQSRVIRLPVNVYELRSKINKVATRLNAQPDRQKPATYNEIAKALDLPAAKVLQVVRASREAKSLDMPVDQSGGSDADSLALVDTLAADLGEAAEDTSQRALKEQVDLALKGLDLRPRNILRYRYGLHSALGRALTLNEVGELYGLKGERVRQIEGLAISMLKKGLQQGLRKTLEDTQVD